MTDNLTSIDTTNSLLDQNDSDKRERKSNIIFLCLSVAVVLLILALRLFVIYPIEVKESSMTPTYESGQLVFVSKLSKVQRGDVVIVEDSTSDKLLIKRVVAVDGDSILLIQRDNGLYYLQITTQDGQVITEKYDDYQVVGIANNIGQLSTTSPFVVNGLYLMGDNRNNSIDSRARGCFSLQSVKGVVLS